MTKESRKIENIFKLLDKIKVSLESVNISDVVSQFWLLAADLQGRPNWLWFPCLKTEISQPKELQNNKNKTSWKMKKYSAKNALEVKNQGQI